MSNKNGHAQYDKERDEIVFDGAEVANTSNKHSVSKLEDVNRYSQNALSDTNETDPMLKTLQRFKYHPSVIAIDQKWQLKYSPLSNCSGGANK